MTVLLYPIPSSYSELFQTQYWNKPYTVHPYPIQSDSYPILSGPLIRRIKRGLSVLNVIKTSNTTVLKV